MKELNEIIERLDSQDEVIENLVKLTAQLEKREVKFPEIHIADYNDQFEQLRGQFENSSTKFGKLAEELKAGLREQNLEYKAGLQGQLDQVKEIVAQIPKVLPIKRQHRFDLKTKGWIIGGIMLLIVVALLAGLSFYLFFENSQLKANDLKFRMIRQAYPKQSKWADTSYERNPEVMRKLTEKLENEAKGPAAETAGQKKRKGKKSKRKAVIAPQPQS